MIHTRETVDLETIRLGGRLSSLSSLPSSVIEEAALDLRSLRTRIIVFRLKTSNSTIVVVVTSGLPWRKVFLLVLVSTLDDFIPPCADWIHVRKL